MLTRTVLDGGNVRYYLTDNAGSVVSLLEPIASQGRGLLLYAGGQHAAHLERETAAELATALLSFAHTGKLPDSHLIKFNFDHLE